LQLGEFFFKLIGQTCALLLGRILPEADWSNFHTEIFDLAHHYDWLGEFCWKLTSQISMLRFLIG